MPDVLLIIAVGTALFLLLAVFIAFMTLAYQQKRMQHQEEVQGLVAAYQKEILKAQLEMQEQTFLTISQEIHDNVGQILSLVRLNISTLDLARVTTAEEKIKTSKQLLDQALQDLRDLSKQLNSKYVARQRLSELLSFQLSLIQKTGVLRTTLQVSGEERPLNPEKKLIVFRIAQEALSNVLRHAAASGLCVRLVYTEKKLTLHINDDGLGYLPPAADSRRQQGTGLHNMRYRAELIGATWSIQGTPGAGTAVLLELPLT